MFKKNYQLRSQMVPFGIINILVHNLCSIQKLTQHPTKGQSGQALSVTKKLVFHGSC